MALSTAQELPHPYPFTWFDWFCLWYPPAWLILFNRHWQHYHPDPDGWIPLEYALFLIPGGFYLALLSRWLRLGCRLPQTENCQIDPAYQQAFRDEILTPIVTHYFQAELIQTENIPETGPLIVILNHAGMNFPWDFLGLAFLLSHQQQCFVQLLAHISLFDHPWVKWWLPPGWSQILGGVPAKKDTFETALNSQNQKTILLYAPEGGRGPAKDWRRRYQLAKFDPSFIRLSQRYQIPILPVICTGSEYLHPLAVNIQKLARLAKLPFFPISFLMIPFLLFPSMGVWAMKTRLRYYIQPLYLPWEDSNSQTPQKTERAINYHKAEALRSQLQNRINQILSEE
jgi:1-acyl-sn-glycerol-3-phosphate acyltransferase